jgi:hypothetical protein
MRAALALASDYTQLAFHGLAHLPIAGPARLYHEDYVEWSREHLAEPARVPIERDAAILTGLYTQTSGSAILQSIPELHADIAQLRLGAARDLDELTPADVLAPSLLALLQRSELPIVELFRAVIALAAPAYEGAWHGWLRAQCADGLEAVRAPLDEARQLSPELAIAKVELVWALGPRGRAFPERIVVGVPGGWGDLSPALPAILALHEASVRARSRELHDADDTDRYVRAEWAALRELAGAMRHASPELRETHARWLGSLGLGALCAAAAHRDLCTLEEAEAIATQPAERVKLLGG